MQPTRISVSRGIGFCLTTALLRKYILGTNMIDLKGIPPEKQLFHNIWIDVYPKRLHIDSIRFWPANARNVLDFDLLEGKFDKKLDKIPEKEIIEFLADQPRLKLADLATSIKKNGVRVPLIVLQDGTLLDGNRRYFACKLIQYEAEEKKKGLPDVLKNISAYVVKKEDTDARTIQKILAEANFVDDYRVQWTLDVKAKVIKDFYSALESQGVDKDSIYKEILDVYSVDKREVDDYLLSLELADEFIDAGKGKKEKLKRRQIVQGKFLYFWEFYNKAYRGRGALNEEEVPKVKGLFFIMMLNDRFKNFKQVEPMVRCIQDEHCWNMLLESKGVKMDEVQAILMEKKAIRSVDDKLRNFLNWLDKLDVSTLTNTSLRKIEEIVAKLRSILSVRG